MAQKKDNNIGVLRYDDTPLASNFPFVSVISAKFVPGYKLVGRKGLESTELSIMGTQNTLTGSYVCAKYIARQCNATLALYGGEGDAFAASKIDEWIDKIAHLKAEKISTFVQEINDHLTLRTFLQGHNITLADIVLFARIKLVKDLQNEINTKAKTLPHLKRWLSYLSTLPAFQEAENLYLGTKPESKSSSSAGAAEKSGPVKTSMGWAGNMEALNLPDLIEGKVVTRFPPEPSGYMHVGHAKAALINNYYAETYKGQIILRFDDTNPSKEKDEYVDNITNDVGSLGIKYSKITHTSDHFELIMQHAEKLIRDGKAYVDDTPVEQMRKEREEGIESVSRSFSPEKNFQLWEEMKKGSEQGQKSVLRMKLSMTHEDKAFRDPAIYRCNLTPHHMTGDKYKVYPLYDFACPIVDSFEGVTHALRSNEYHNKINLYYHYCDIMGIRKPIISDYSRLSFQYILLSKRKLQYFVDKGLVSGWNDPRLPTVQGMLRRGLTVPALKEFVLTQGAGAANSTIEIGKLWAGNKNYLEPIAPRYTAVAKQGAVKFTLTNVSDVPEVKELPKVPKNKDLGNKKVTFSKHLYLEVDDCRQIKQGEEVTLMNWGNAIVQTIQYDADGTTPVSMEGVLHLEGDFKKTEKKLTWLSADVEPVQCIIQDFDFIITKAKLEEEDELEKFITPQTKFELECIADPNIKTLKVGDKIQFERRGFFNVDQVGDATKPYVLIYIPDSKHKPQGQSLYPFRPAEKPVKPVAPAGAKKNNKSK
eukprot:gene9288-11384_t